MNETCEYPDCDETEDLVEIGFTVDGLVEHERTYCLSHMPSASVIDP
jgi:hypothetical protein